MKQLLRVMAVLLVVLLLAAGPLQTVTVAQAAAEPLQQEPVTFATATPLEAGQLAEPLPVEAEDPIVQQPVEVVSTDADAPVWYEKTLGLIFAVLGLLGFLLVSVTGSSLYMLNKSVPVTMGMQLASLLTNASPGRTDNDRLAVLLRQFGYEFQQDVLGNISGIRPKDAPVVAQAAGGRSSAYGVAAGAYSPRKPVGKTERVSAVDEDDTDWEKDGIG